MHNDFIDIIRKKIIEFQYQPGDLLNEVELAKELNVSRTPIREALIQLSTENLVTIKKGSSARVSEINMRDFQNLIEYRLVLERGAARLAAVKATDSHIKQLENIQEKVNGMEKDNLSEMIDIDCQFHRILHNATENPYLIQSMTNVMNKFVIILRQISYRSKGFLSCLPQVIEALRKNDEDKMEQLMVAHLEDFIDQFARYSLGRR
jgi:DNA-binding GntR family transcriptional regulator